MKTRKKTFKILLLSTFILILLASPTVFANNSLDSFYQLEYSEEFLRWLSLSDEEKQKIKQPKMFDVPNTKIESNNPFQKAKMIKATLSPRFSLKDQISDNLSIKNQGTTNSCWAFSSLSSLETNLALQNYKKGVNTSKVYDFSERHLEYSTSRFFANGVENPHGYIRKVGDGGGSPLALSYFTNGSGPINESSMPFENNEDLIDISKIQNKTVTAQVFDTKHLALTNSEADKNIIKEHIQNYGSLDASVHGANLFGESCYNNATGAIFCNNRYTHPINHGVSIIGWDDNYSIDNFNEEHRPQKNGAWIIRNSWGEKIESSLSELKTEIFNEFQQECISKGWTSPSLIPNEFIEFCGYTIKNDMAYMKIGDNGIMYVSYEDCNIYADLFGVLKSSDKINYDNIYQYNEFTASSGLGFMSSDFMLCNIFDKQTTGDEYLTQVSLEVPETYTCKVYVNPNGTSKAKSDLQLVNLKAGSSETLDAGYHTLEFAEPIKINSDKFAIALEIQTAQSSNGSILLEAKMADFELFDSVKVETGKCFIALGNNPKANEWLDLSKMSSINPSLNNGDSTIKAFTISNIVDDSLKDIKITTPPTKTKYFEKENFDKTGMVVTANYNNNTSSVLDSSSYNITNGTDLKAGQTSVTITYENKSTTQPITVEKNSVTKLEITTPPTKTNYVEGENFDRTGMTIKATFKDGSTKTITDYTIENGNNLKGNQTQVTISYDGQSVPQTITVTPNPLVKIEISKTPDKTKYVVGQNFDKSGMIVTGTYENNATHEIIDYTIEDGTNLKLAQTSVTIKYEDKTATQTISVEEKAITSISISSKPSKLSYIQNKEDLDLTGGILKVTYNDETTENINLTSSDVVVTGFDNKTLGTITLTVTYQEKSAHFDVTIIEEEKPENANFDNSKCDVKKIQEYFFTDESKKEYLLMNLLINNVARSSKNDNTEYYYFFSSNSNETNIKDWVKIKEKQDSNNKLQFTSDSRDITKMIELTEESKLYIYVKEVATKGGNQSIAISKAIPVNSDVEPELYLDNEKIDWPNNEGNNNNNNNDLPNKDLPFAGMTTIVIILITVISTLGIILFIRYKHLNKYVK